jgi:geranylgeranyl diphosphate synthase type II
MKYSIPELQQKFENYLQDNHFQQAPQSLYEPVNYIMQLGGKRLRPLLALMAYQMFDEKVEKALPIALAVETFHNFSLVHDDIMDEALIRRGKACVHTKFGLNAGILSGDVMLIWVYQHLLKVENADKISDLVTIFNQVAIEVCEGQQYDIDFESRTDVQIEEYIKMIELKTAALMAGSLQMGAIVAGAKPEAVQQLDQFGRLIGIAFQLQDDWLDTFGEKAKVGKKIGGDIVQNKKTYLILKALELVDDKTRKELLEAMSTPTVDEEAKIKWVKGILNEYQVGEKTAQLRDEYREKAFSYLDQIEADETVKNVIKKLADKLVYREL